ncbi:MAG TPA: aspartyl protease family protein [Methylomirabilota bacterium]|nr:aspartyl protease family protein [Methylomirabilota bacterium]
MQKLIPAAIVAFLLLALLKAAAAQSDASELAPPQTNAVRLFLSADESSEVVATLKNQEPYVPLAETSGMDGVKWYLVKAQTGVTGWIKETDKEEAKKLDSHFKTLAVELSFSRPRELSSSPSASASGNRITVPVESNGSLVIVRVTFNGSLTANLFLDTGAMRTMISRRIARSLGLSTLGSAMMAGIGGAVTTPITRLQSVKVGDAEVPNLIVSIHDFSHDPRVEGLLGLDFLNQFEVSIDARKRQLLLVPR